MSLDKTHTRRVCPVRNARRYETAEPHQDSQGRARTSAARDEGMPQPQGAPVAPRGHRGRCKTDAESARVTARAKGACKADATRAGLPRERERRNADRIPCNANAATTRARVVQRRCFRQGVTAQAGAVQTDATKGRGVTVRAGAVNADATKGRR